MMSELSIAQKQYILSQKKTPTHCADRKKQYLYSFFTPLGIYCRCRDH